MHHAKLGLFVLLCGLLLMGCTAMNSSGGTNGANGTGANASQSPTVTTQASAAATITGVLDSSENYSAVMRYDPNTHQAVIAATQYMDENDREQLNFSCVLGSAFMLFINDPRIYGQSGMVNGSLQVKLPPAKHDQYVQGSGLTKEQFAAMNVTHVSFNFLDRATNATLGRCEQQWGQDPTIDGVSIPTHKAPSPTQSATAETNETATAEPNETTTATAQAANETDGTTTTIAGFCEQYHYSNCPASCVQVCTPSACNGDVCTADCDGKGSCLAQPTTAA